MLVSRAEELVIPLYLLKLTPPSQPEITKFNIEIIEYVCKDYLVPKSAISLILPALIAFFEEVLQIFLANFSAI